MILYKDLLRIHLESGNPSLRAYLEGVQAVAPLVGRLEAGGEEALAPGERKDLEEFFRKLFVPRDITAKRPQRSEGSPTPSLLGQLAHWKDALGVRPGQTVQDRLAEMFLRPFGLRSIPEALDFMEKTKREAGAHNRHAVAELAGQPLQLREGDLLKRVKSEYFVSFLQNGNVCGECLGYAADSDNTPLDTDLGLVLANDAAQGNRAALEASPSKSGFYGDLLLLVRPRPGRFVWTKAGQKPNWSKQLHRAGEPAYEVFKSGYLGIDKDRHVGIRTGFPFADAWVICPPQQRRLLLDLKMDLVENGFYVPIFSEEGELLFSPEECDRLRATAFAGTGVDGDVGFLVDRSAQSAKQESAVLATIQAMEDERPVVEGLKRTIEGRLAEALRSVGIPLRTDGELAVGAEIHNVGSTARFTSVPGGTIDFDLTIRLDQNDLQRKDDIVAALDRLLPGEEVLAGGTAQWRRAKVDIDGRPVDIDIVFAEKPEVEGMPSHAMVERRLRAIERQSPNDAAWVRANIVHAKEVLKAAKVYKKTGEGSIGGLGVENWILQHGGSFARARAAVLEAALGPGGTVRKFAEFAEHYAIPDPGSNFVRRLDLPASGEEETYEKPFRHDDFIYLLNRTENPGYERFVQALQAVS